MKLLRRSTKCLKFLEENTAATIGNFDGIHRGHQALLERLREQAQRLNLPTLVILFEPQASEFFLGSEAPPRITRLREKLKILKQYNIDYVYCLRFDKNLAKMQAFGFAEQLIFSKLCVKYLIVGKDFRFGHKREGDVTLLQQLSSSWSATVDIYPDLVINEQRVSSTLLRNCLKHSRFEMVKQLLGRDFSMIGRVIHGDGRGRQWGVPTANLNVHRKVLPLQGIFCVLVKRKKHDEFQWIEGVSSLGNRPTVDGSKNLLEVYLFNFDESLYGEIIEVFFLHKLRDEVKFPSVEDLITQIYADIEMAKSYFRND